MYGQPSSPAAEQHCKDGSGDNYRLQPLRRFNLLGPFIIFQGCRDQCRLQELSESATINLSCVRGYACQHAISLFHLWGDRVHCDSFMALARAAELDQVVVFAVTIYSLGPCRGRGPIVRRRTNIALPGGYCLSHSNRTHLLRLRRPHTRLSANRLWV